MGIRSPGSWLAAAVLAVLLAPLATRAQDGNRMAFVDLRKAVFNSQEGRSAQEKFAKLEEEKLKELRPRQDQLRGLEEEYEKLAGETGMPVYKFRGDEQREFVGQELNTKSFPTINYIGADGSATKYESEDRSVAAMAAFAKAGGKVAA